MCIVFTRTLLDISLRPLPRRNGRTDRRPGEKFEAAGRAITLVRIISVNDVRRRAEDALAEHSRMDPRAPLPAEGAAKHEATSLRG